MASLRKICINDKSSCIHNFIFMLPSSFAKNERMILDLDIAIRRGPKEYESAAIGRAASSKSDRISIEVM